MNPLGTYLTHEATNKVISDINAIEAKHKSSVMALGNFDGLHIGHQELIKTSINVAKSHNLKSAILTFNPHPVQVLNPSINFLPLLSYKDKINYLSSYDIDYIFIVGFEAELAKLAAIPFVKNFLCPIFSPKFLITGYNFHFGKNKSGDVKLLSELSQELGFIHTVIKEVKYNYMTVSTSNIKNLLSQGRIETVNALLGRNYKLSGTVVRGGEVARKYSNTPTANILVSESIKLPLNGVYIVKTLIDNKEYFGIANLGVKPTSDSNSNKNMEVHLLGFEGDLYGKYLVIELLSFLRPERKFVNLDMLKDQIKRDIQNAGYVIKNLK